MGEECKGLRMVIVDSIWVGDAVLLLMAAFR